ncbi:MAG TPA: hypothetical protein VJU14_07245 [Solirubrobacterales bacterium]|nr:hypothetical protein [Solirubrobacterales bacterium]
MSVSELEQVRRPQAFEPCEECGAAMDPQQRYCVNCAARRGNGTNPASRYFATMSRQARRPLVAPAAKKPGTTSRAAAVGFFALLPLAVALGVMVGRGGGSDDGSSEALLQALRDRPAATTASTAAGPTTANTASKAGKQAKGDQGKTKGEGKVIATTANGPVHSVTDFKASKTKEAEDTKLVEENPAQVGEDYITAQQNLPDVVVVGGDPGSAPAPTSPEGVEP